MSEGFQKIIKWFRRLKKNKHQSTRDLKYDYEEELEDAKFKFLANYNENPSPLSVASKDFDFDCHLGKGGFSDVYLAKNKDSKKYFAIKIIKKSMIKSDRDNEHFKSEISVHRHVHFPFIVNFKGHFEGENNYFLLLEYLGGGTLSDYFGGRFWESHAKFYAATVFMALEFLHSIDVVYRDLKPENMLVDDRGYVKLSDLGFAKRIRDRTSTFCGTIEYFAPEIYLDSNKKSGKGYGKEADWWSYGIFLVEMVTGSVPFRAKGSREYVKQIISSELKYDPPAYVTNDFKDLVTHLLRPAGQRYGGPNLSYKLIQMHHWFHDVNWDDIYHRRATPPKIYRKNSKLPVEITWK